MSIKSLKNSTQPHFALTRLLPPQLPDSLSCDGGLAWQSAQYRPQPTTEQAPRMRSRDIPEILMQQEVSLRRGNLLLRPWQVDMTVNINTCIQKVVILWIQGPAFHLEIPLILLVHTGWFF